MASKNPKKIIAQTSTRKEARERGSERAEQERKTAPTHQMSLRVLPASALGAAKGILYGCND
jgi:hypothetical protein